MYDFIGKVCFVIAASVVVLLILALVVTAFIASPAIFLSIIALTAVFVNGAVWADRRWLQ